VLFLPLDPGWGKIWIRDGEKSGSGMKIPDNYSESLETVYRVKNTGTKIL
jgi:hypothetical protein